MRCLFSTERGDRVMAERNIHNELATVFAQTYDGTIKKDNLSNAALSFEQEFQAMYFAKMDTFMKSQDAYEVFQIND